jgi:predicted nucleic acid-binding protein
VGGADAIHLAGALRAGADVFFTYDKRILATSDVGIRVAEPFFRGQLSLSDEPEQEPRQEPE